MNTVNYHSSSDWRKLPVYDGRYFINEKGEVVNSVTGLQMKRYHQQGNYNGGYNLTYDYGCNRYFTLHSLMSMVFDSDIALRFHNGYIKRGVKILDLQENKNLYFESLSSAARYIGCTTSTIYDRFSGKTKNQVIRKRYKIIEFEE